MKNMIKVGMVIFLSAFTLNVSLAQNKDRVETLKRDFQYLIRTGKWQEAEQKMIIFYNQYPANPTELDRVEKYEVDKFSSTIKAAIYAEERSYNAIKKDKSLKLCQAYLDKYPYGKYRSEVQSIFRKEKEESAWRTAKSKGSISAYYEYLDNFPNGNYATIATETINRWDENAYNKAISEGTQDDLNYYLNNYPRGKYITAVRNKLTERKEYDVYMYAKNHNYIEDYETYIKTYPQGKYASEVNRIIENSYYKFGNDAYSSKEYRSAKDYYETYLSKYPNGTYSSEVRSKIKRCKRRINQTSAGFIAYSYDANCPVGISFGKLNRKLIGFYGTLRINKDLFTSLNGTIDNIGNKELKRFDNAVQHYDLQKTKVPNAAGSFGLTFKVAYPLYSYLGVGVIYTSTYHKWEASNEGYLLKDADRKYWLRNTDMSAFNIYPEVGLILKISNFLILKYGVMYLVPEIKALNTNKYFKNKHFIQQFGIGFQL